MGLAAGSVEDHLEAPSVVGAVDRANGVDIRSVSDQQIHKIRVVVGCGYVQ